MVKPGARLSAARSHGPQMRAASLAEHRGQFYVFFNFAPGANLYTMPTGSPVGLLAWRTEAPASRDGGRHRSRPQAALPPCAGVPGSLEHIELSPVHDGLESYPVVGLGPEDAPSFKQGVPYVALYDHDGDFSWNPNNYVDGETCRIKPRS